MTPSFPLSWLCVIYHINCKLFFFYSDKSVSLHFSTLRVLLIELRGSFPWALPKAVPRNKQLSLKVNFIAWRTVKWQWWRLFSVSIAFHLHLLIYLVLLSRATNNVRKEFKPTTCVLLAQSSIGYDKGDISNFINSVISKANIKIITQNCLKEYSLRKIINKYMRKYICVNIRLW